MSSRVLFSALSWSEHVRCCARIVARHTGLSEVSFPPTALFLSLLFDVVFFLHSGSAPARCLRQVQQVSCVIRDGPSPSLTRAHAHRRHSALPSEVASRPSQWCVLRLVSLEHHLISTLLGDPKTIHHILSEISKEKHKTTDDEVDIGAAALHLAIRCASSTLPSQRLTLF